MHVRLAAAAAWIAVLALALPARAAVPDSPSDPDPDRPPHSEPGSIAPLAPAALRDAIRAAWLRYPGRRAELARLNAAAARRDAAARPLYNPELAFARDDEGPEVTTTVGVSLALDVGGKRVARRDAAVARLALSAAEARLARRDFVRRWLVGWSALRGAERRVEIGARRTALAQRFADLAGRQFAAGDLSGLERDLARLAHDEAQAQQVALLDERADAAAALRALDAAVDAAATPSLPGDALPAAGVAVADVGDDRGVGDRASIEAAPEWRVADAALRASVGEIAVARGERVPDPTLGFSAGRIRVGSASDRVFGVSLSVPLLVRNAHRAEIVAASADAEAAAAERERVALELAAERARAADGHAAAAAAWRRWQGSRAADTERRAALLERTWRAGELSTSDYLQQWQQTLDTALAGAELEARLWRAFADHLAATGRLERWAGLEDMP